MQETEGYLLQALEEVHSVLNRCVPVLLASAMILISHLRTAPSHMALCVVPTA